MEDIDILANFRLQMFRDMGLIRDENQAEELVEASKNYFQSVFGTDHLLATIAENDGVAVAVGILAISHSVPKPGNISGIEGYIYNMYTLPQWRNQGIGAQIFDRLLTTANNRGVEYCWLFATEAGRPIYARQGFVPTSTLAMKKMIDHNE